jgi:hypothetical protein
MDTFLSEVGKPTPQQPVYLAHGERFGFYYFDEQRAPSGQ